MKVARAHGRAESETSTFTLEVVIAYLLRAGIVTSLLFIVAGTGLTLVRHPDYLSSTEALERVTAPGNRPHTVADVLQGIQMTRGQAFVMVGLLWLALVPFMRVAVSILAFRQQRDAMFVAICGTVLALLAVSVILGSTAH